MICIRYDRSSFSAVTPAALILSAKSTFASVAERTASTSQTPCASGPLEASWHRQPSPATTLWLTSSQSGGATPARAARGRLSVAARPGSSRGAPGLVGRRLPCWGGRRRGSFPVDSRRFVPGNSEAESRAYAPWSVDDCADYCTAPRSCNGFERPVDGGYCMLWLSGAGSKPIEVHHSLAPPRGRAHA